MSINFTKEHLERLKFLENLYETTGLPPELETELEELEEFRYSRLEEIKKLEAQEETVKLQKRQEYDTHFKSSIISIISTWEKS